MCFCLRKQTFFCKRNSNDPARMIRQQLPFRMMHVFVRYHYFICYNFLQLCTCLSLLLSFGSAYSWMTMDAINRRAFIRKPIVASVSATIATIATPKSVKASNSYSTSSSAETTHDTVKSGATLHQPTETNPHSNQLTETNTFSNFIENYWVDEHQKQQKQLFDTFYPNWKGTELPLRSLQESVEAGYVNYNQNNYKCWPMCRWPDPVLRRPADPVEDHWFGTKILADACNILINTARIEGAVGLAAQQCAINARIVALNVKQSNRYANVKQHQLIQHRLTSTSSNHNDNEAQDKEKDPKPQSFVYNNEIKRNDKYIVFVNPRIVQRSPETEMRVWTEQCLVLPPTFYGTIIRDAWVQLEYQDYRTGDWYTCRLHNDASRTIQHELDHDNGILLTDHIALDELENIIMQTIEQQQPIQIRIQQQSATPKKLTTSDKQLMADVRFNESNKGHETIQFLPNRKERTEIAYNRYVQNSILLSSS